MTSKTGEKPGVERQPRAAARRGIPVAVEMADEVTALRVENRELRRLISGLSERMEFLEDSLDAHMAMQDFKDSGEEAIPWEVVKAELNASR